MMTVNVGDTANSPLEDAHENESITASGVSFNVPPSAKNPAAIAAGISDEELEKQKSTNPNEDALVTARRYVSQGRNEEAEKFFKQALKQCSTGLATGDRTALQVIEEMSWYYVQRKQYAAAQPLLLSLFESRSKTLRADDDLLVRTCEKLATVHENLGQFDEAQIVCRSLLKQQEDTLGSNAPACARTMHRLADCFLCQRDFENAEAMLIKALAIEEFNFGIYSSEINATLQALVNVFVTAKKYDLAEYLLIKHVSILEKIHGDKGLSVASGLLQLAEIVSKNDKPKDAETYYHRALAIYRDAFGDDTKPVSDIKFKLEMLYPNNISSGLSQLMGQDIVDACQDLTPVAKPTPTKDWA